MHGNRCLLAAILAAAAVLRLYPIWFGLPHLYARPDEEVAVGKAVGVILRGEFNPKFFHWPSLTFYLFAALFGITRLLRRVAGLDPALTGAQHLVIARACVACAGTATVYVLYRIARRVGDQTGVRPGSNQGQTGVRPGSDPKSTGLIAALFLAVAVLHVRDSHFAMTDILMTLFVTISLALVLRGTDSEDRRLLWFGAAGAAGGLAASTKYNGAAVLAAMAGAQIVLWSPSWRGVLSIRSWIPSLVFGALFAAAFVIATPFAILDYTSFKSDLVYDFTHLSLGHTIDLGIGWIYHATHSLPYGTGFAVFGAAFVGLVPLVRHHPRHAFVLLVFFATFYIGIGNGRTVFFRYVLPLVPLVCLFAAVAVRHAAEWLSRRFRIQRGVVIASLSLLVAAPSAVNAVWFDVVLARRDTRAIAREWLVPQLTPASTLHDAGGEYARLDLGGLRYHRWYFDESADSFGHPVGETPDWLVLPESPVSSYTSVPLALRLLAARDYDLVKVIRGTGTRRSVAMYDQQDAFFMPFSGFSSVDRPGPTLRIYRRRN
ncbi:MAG: glycosyltransferase family 39 protein [Vicinamibacterales bacterium]